MLDMRVGNFLLRHTNSKDAETGCVGLIQVAFEILIAEHTYILVKCGLTSTPKV
jgi:hypothetical protein